jgi:cytochrome c oxidase subunit II
MKMIPRLPKFIAALFLAVLFIVPSMQAQGPRRIEITAKRFDFAPGEITLKKGEPVVLVLKSTDVPHGVRFKELGIETKISKGKDSSELAFTPNKTGTFVGHCAVFCGSGHGKMALTIHVVD